MRGRRLLNGLTALYGLAGLAIFGWALIRVDADGVTVGRILLFMGLPLTLAIGMFACLRASVGTRAMVVLNVTAVVVAVYGYQIYVEVSRAWERENRIKIVEARTGRPFDRRSKGEVIVDLRAKGVDAYPSHAMRFMPMPLDLGGQSVIAFSGRSGRPTVLCNESGAFTVYDADRYGFNNPDTAWPAAGERADIVAIGDSFTHGACVAPGEAFPDRLRELWPATLNLGYGGTGSLVHLAVLREYAATARPRVVLWVYFENDLKNLLDERLQPLFLRYVEAEGTVGLAGLQQRLDQLIDSHMDQTMKSKGYDRFDWRRRVADFVLLRELRERFGLNFRGKLAERESAVTQEEALQLFGRVLSAAKNQVTAWGGRMYVVYLPSIEHFIPAPPTVELKMRESVLAKIYAVGLPLIDLKPAMDMDPAPAERYFFYPGSHYTPEGFALVAEIIRRALEADLSLGATN